MTEMGWIEFIAVVAVPALAALTSWVWRLDTRMFNLSQSMLGREEFLSEIRAMRVDITELRRMLYEQTQKSCGCNSGQAYKD